MTRAFSEIWIIGILAAVLAGGFFAWQYFLPKEVTFDDLVSNPEKYNKSNVVVEGFYLFSFEVNIFVKELAFLPPDNRVRARGGSIWIGGGKGLDEFDFNKLHQQTIMGENVYYGKVKIRGRFEYGEQYGHLGYYNYQIFPSEMEILQWSSPVE